MDATLHGESVQSWSGTDIGPSDNTPVTLGSL